MEVEFLWSQQTSEFGADGPGGALAISDMKIVNYFGNFVYNWGEGDARMRPFMFGGFGATSYRFGDFLKATVLLSAASATLLAALTVIGLSNSVDRTPALVCAAERDHTTLREDIATRS